MKSLLFIFIVLLLPYIAKSQQETLVTSTIESGAYGGPLIKFGGINGEPGVFIGGQGAWIINHQFAIGGKGYALINEVEAENLQNVKLEFGLGGVLLEYIIQSDKLLHFNVHTMIGAGGVRYAVINYRIPSGSIDYSEDGVFIMEPGADLVLNINNFFRVGAGLTYRIVSGVDYENLSNNDLSGLSAHIVLKFGVF